MSVFIYQPFVRARGGRSSRGGEREREREREVNASESKCAFFFDARETERVRFFRFLCVCPPGVFPARGNRQTQRFSSFAIYV